jgi:hypothetical protein
MIKWLRILVGALRSAFRLHRELVLENLALRQQLAVFKHRYPRPRLKHADRLFWRSFGGTDKALSIIGAGRAGVAVDRN